LGRISAYAKLLVVKWISGPKTWRPPSATSANLLPLHASQHDPSPPYLGCAPRNPRRRSPPASLLRPSRNAGSRRPSTVPCAVTPSRSRRPTPLMGCAASSDRAERRGRGLARGHSEASTAGLLLVGPADQEPLAGWRRRCCKVAPEPKEAAPEPAMPDSPSFRYYCQKAAAVDALVAEADGEGSVRIMGKLPPRPLLADCYLAPATGPH
jgi:hypothetical protein